MTAPATMQSEAMLRSGAMTDAGNDAEQQSDVGAPPACGGEERRHD